jgi:hypothetical protein
MRGVYWFGLVVFTIAYCTYFFWPLQNCLECMEPQQQGYTFSTHDEVYIIGTVITAQCAHGYVAPPPNISNISLECVFYQNYSASWNLTTPQLTKLLNCNNNITVDTNCVTRPAPARRCIKDTIFIAMDIAVLFLGFLYRVCISFLRRTGRPYSTYLFFLPLYHSCIDIVLIAQLVANIAIAISYSLDSSPVVQIIQFGMALDVSIFFLTVAPLIVFLQPSLSKRLFDDPINSPNPNIPRFLQRALNQVLLSLTVLVIIRLCLFGSSGSFCIRNKITAITAFLMLVFCLLPYFRLPNFPRLRPSQRFLPVAQVIYLGFYFVYGFNQAKSSTDELVMFDLVAQLSAEVI